MKKIIEYVKKYYLYIIIIFVILFLIILIGIVIMFKPKETVQVPEIKLEQLEEKNEDIIVETVKIDIKGNIANPGVYELEQGSRVIDAINIAGGLLENSNTELINLSQILTDEMIIIVYTNDQIEKYRQNSKEIEYVYIEIEKCPDQINDACINQTENIDKSEETDTLININEADINELMTLSGIGESKAKDIIEYRDKNGKFTVTQDITNVKGIGESLFEKIKDYITV